MFLSQADFSLDKLFKAVKGEMMFAVTDLEIKERSDTTQALSDQGPGSPVITTSIKPDAKTIFVLSVDDKTSFQQLLDVANKQMNNMRKPNDKMNFKLGDKWFVAGNSEENINKFLAGPSEKPAFASRITGHPFGMYVDLQRILLAASASKDTSKNQAAIDASLKIWQDIVATGGEFKNKAIEYSAEINLVDKNTNSLKQLNAYLDQMSILYKDKIKKLKDMHALKQDSIHMAPVETVPAPAN
jgi:hypothetical protein